jgi:hypothetical protein
MRGLAWLVAILAITPAAIATAPADESRTADVTYVTASSVYLSVGREEGLALGTRLALKRGDEVVATLEVTELSSHRSACSIVEKLLDPEVGDTVEFRPTEVEPAVAPVAATVERSARRPRGGAMRGRIGLRYLAVGDRTDQTGDYSQPAVDLRLDGNNLGGSAWGLSVDARARRTYRTAADGTSDDEGRTRVYRLAILRRSPRDPWSLAVGRQYSAALAAVSIFDGVSADYRRERWNVGLFSGSQPDAEDYAYSGQIREHGVYFQFRGRPRGARNWLLTTGLIGSYDESEVNREFLYLQGRYTGPRLSTYLAQEVDYNRDWKTDVGEDTLSATSTFASLRFRASRSVTLHGGYDNRRNVRLYRDRVTPITEFDDSFRRGLWAGASLKIRNRYRFGVDVRTNRREDAEDADSYTASFGANHVGGSKLDVHARSTRYTNDRLEGWLHAVDAGVQFASRSYLRVEGGVRDETNLTGVVPGETLHWFGIDTEIGLGRRWYLLLSLERTTGESAEVDQLYSSLTYRF